MAYCEVPEELVGYGTLWQYQDPITSEWVLVGGGIDMDTPDDVTEAIETTTTSGGQAYITRIPSPLNSLEPAEFEVNWRKGQMAKLRNFKRDHRILAWRIVLPNLEQTYMQFCAFISKLGNGIPMKDLVKATIELTPSGEPTWDDLNG